jgi:hypothetical protein
MTVAVSYSPPSVELLTPAYEAEAIEEKTYHIPILFNDSVETYIEYFRTRRKGSFQQWLDRSARYLPVMKEIFRNEKLPEELVYVAMIESGFDPDAVSRAKAVGPWQFMSDTARQYGLRSDWWVDERKDHIKSTRAAAQHFRDLRDLLGSWSLVLAAYNAGTGKVQRAMLRTGSNDFWDLKETAHLRRETKGFVPKFMAAALIARDPAAYGFRVPEDEPLRYDEVVIEESMDLGIVAFCTDSTYAMIKSLNPEINDRFTPPDVPRYLLKIPEGKKKIFAVRSAEIREAALRIPWEEKVSISLFHRVGSGRGFRNSPATCSMSEKKVTLAERSYQLVDHRNSTQNSGPLFTGGKGGMGSENPLKVCASRIQPGGMHQYLGLWPLPFFSNTTDRRR